MTLKGKKHTAGRSKQALARKQLTSNELFFYEHAGYSYKAPETAEQGRIRGAKELAKAEQTARNLNWMYEWSDDWEVGSHKDYYGKGSCYEDSEPSTCEFCVLYDENGEVLESLGCIDDASPEYRRVIEAELALEAEYKLDREIETIDAH